MKRSAISGKFSKIADSADTWNIRNKMKRFFPMSNHRGHHLIEIGLYDYKTKRYFLCDTNSPFIERELNNMEEAIRSA